jgi:hypothetical protein
MTHHVEKVRASFMLEIIAESGPERARSLLVQAPRLEVVMIEDLCGRFGTGLSLRKLNTRGSLFELDPTIRQSAEIGE